MSHNYKKLVVWQKGMDLVVLIYDLLKHFPQEELYGLSSQMKRAVVSIVSNIAEGSRRSTEKDRKHFFIIALGSVSELETQIEVAKKHSFISEKECETSFLFTQEISKMLFVLSRNLSSDKN